MAETVVPSASRLPSPTRFRWDGCRNACIGITRHIRHHIGHDGHRQSRAHLSLVPSGPSLGPRGPAGIRPVPGRRPAFTRHSSRWDITHLSHTRTRILAHSPSRPLPVALDSHHREQQPSNLQPNRFPRAHSPITAMAMPLDTPAHALTQHSRPPVSVLIVPYVCARQLLRADPLSNKHWSVVRPPHPHALPSSEHAHICSTHTNTHILKSVQSM